MVAAQYRRHANAPRGPEQAEVLTFAADMRRQGASVLLASTKHDPDAQLHIGVGEHEVLDSVSAIQSFYVMVEALARARGLDPDQPPRLKKVTLTR